jgi:hypothetical protein
MQFPIRWTLLVFHNPELTFHDRPLLYGSIRIYASRYSDDDGRQGKPCHDLVYIFGDFRRL